MDCKLILPSEKLILESKTIVENKILRKQLINESRDSFLRNYQKKFNNTLNKQYKLEESEKISSKIIGLVSSNVWSMTS